MRRVKDHLQRRSNWAFNSDAELASLSAAVAAAGLSAYVLLDAASSALTSVVNLKRTFEGAAYEDIFGLGFWPMWGLFALLEAAALLVCWRTARPSIRRVLLGALLLAFAVASVAACLSWQREEAVFWAGATERHAV